MNSEPFTEPREVFPLRRGRGDVVLEANGVRVPRRLSLAGSCLTPYTEIAHLALSPHALRIGARRSVYALRRRDFAIPNTAQALLHGIVERIRSLPDGNARLVHMAKVEVVAHGPRRLRAVSGVAIACLLVFLLQLTALGPRLSMAGSFSATFLEIGDHWRLVTANLLHGGPVHLTLNMLGLIGLGALVEWPLGPARAFLVFVVSGLGAMGASYLAGYEAALGASGMVMGAAGAVLYLELFTADWLPVGWRIPRRLFLAVLGLQAALEIAAAWLFPVLASAAHVGGFLTGFACTALITGRDPRKMPTRRLVLAADALLALVVALSVGLAARDVAGDPGWFAPRAERLLARADADAVALNDLAWRMVTSHTAPTSEEVRVATALATRAVEQTERSDPNMLDTLAEVHFVAGRVEEAIATIDEAIALAPRVRYFREQRRRFTGERDPDARPVPPGGPPWLAPPTEPEETAPADPPLIRV
ncbi:MAG: rhomboid family intramembrane serine protease [Deltaproteobacteria bacterium]|nr:MAG: rhomboid family intramembrane serine protease [Deltaproteobacteria bacterium]